MSLTIQESPVAAVVKDSTQQLHTEVESLLFPHLSSVKNVADYAAILNLFYGYFSPLENCIQQHITPAVLPDIRERRNAAFILHDLGAIGCSKNNILFCDRLPQIETTAQAFVALYVLEGSTLGGKMIAKMLLKNPALALNEDALTFFRVINPKQEKNGRLFLLN